MKQYICKHCGQIFTDSYKLRGHITHCKMNPNYEINKINCNNLDSAKIKKTKAKDTTLYTCPFCNKECVGKNSYNNHIRVCKSNPDRKISAIEIYNQFKKENNISIWNKGLTKFSNESLHQASLKKLNRPSKMKGKHLTEEHKSKIRLGFIKYIEKLKNKNFKCAYNKTACEYINKLNLEKGWNLQHAENGGEVRVGGYFLDGYDQKLNIVFEYDECKHYEDVMNNILTEKDIKRQEYIIKELNCEFWRYNEQLNLLYKV